MQTSERGRRFLAAHEGVVLRAYRDVAGVWTIGVGHTARAGPPVPRAGMTVSRAEAEAILARDLARFEARVAATGAFRAQAPFDGAVSFDFNTGRIHNASWVRHYRAGASARAEASLMRWVKAGGRTWPGLRRRRAAEADLIFRGRYCAAGSTGDGAGDDGDAKGGGVRQDGAAVPRRTEAPRPDTAAMSTTRADVRAYQTQLRALGHYSGAIDGRAGPATLAAVRAFQRAHPHLAEDGIVGPATRAALTRALAAARTATNGAGAAVTGGCGAGVAAAAAQEGSDPLAAGLLVAGLLLAALGGYLFWRYRDEIRLALARL